MKRLVSLTLLLVVSTALSAQQAYKSDKLKISFKAPYGLDAYSDDPNHIGYDNDVLAVEIEVFDWSSDKVNYDQGAMVSARTQTTALGFKDFSDGAALNGVENAFYCIALDEEEDEVVSVFVLSILVPEKQKVYEIQVYCYEITEEAGKKIVDSIRLMD